MELDKLIINIRNKEGIVLTINKINGIKILLTNQLSIKCAW